MSKIPATEQSVRPVPRAVKERSADRALLSALERRLLRVQRGLRKTLDECGNSRPGERAAGEK